MSLTYGSLFHGYGGLDGGVMSVLGGELAWYAEYDKAASKIGAFHHPDVPNLGDVTKVDWHAVPKVDVITGGSPCQDLSHAGKRAGMTNGTRSNLWVEMREAIAVIRPRLVVWENVRGALSAPADSALEPCPGCMGDADDGPVLRALGRVLGDLAELRYDAWWYGLRAADVGAAHGRFREFLYATPADALSGGWSGWAPHALGRPVERVTAPGRREVPSDLTLLPTPTSSDTNGPGAHGDGGMDLRTVTALLPTPTTTQRGPDANLEVREGAQANLHNEAIGHSQDWREYEPAIRRAEAVFAHRPAPPPTETGAKGQPRLSPLFVEWLMGLPEGHVTDPRIGISRNDQLKALGNGVVPQQCAAATRAWLHDISKERAA